MSFKIIYECDSNENDIEYIEWDTNLKGLRNDVVVEIDSKKYKLCIISMSRLQQEFESWIKDDGYYMVDPNLIIVKNVTKQEIEFTIKKLYESKYFESLDKFGF